MNILTNYFWLGDLASFSTILSLEDAVEVRMAKALEANEKFELFAYGDDTEDDDVVEYQIVDGLAIIPVVGSLIARDSWISRIFGMSSYESIRRMLNHAAENEEVKRIVMDFNTQGGTSEGVDEVGLLIAHIDKNIKPVHGFTSSAANSAGYWLISACRDITCTKMANLGSIGVVTIHKDITKMLKNEGIEVTVFRDGEFKAKPNPYEKLDQKTRDMINNSLSILGNFFLDWVAEQRDFDRENIRAAVGEGRVFFGAEAVQNGLADRIMFFEELLETLKLVDSIDEPDEPKKSSAVTVSFDSSPVKEALDTIIGAIQGSINDRDTILINSERNLKLTNTGDTDMSADNKKSSKPAGKTIKTVQGDMTLAQAKASVELGTLEMTDELKTAMAALESDSASEANTAEEKLDPKAPVLDSDKQEGEDAVLTHVQTQLTEQISINTKLQLELETAKSKLSTQDDTVTALSQIALNSCQKMTVAMGGTPIDLTSMDTATLLNHHTNLAEQFTKSFKVGAVAAVVTEDEHDDADKGANFVAPLHTVSFN